MHFILSKPQSSACGLGLQLRSTPKDQNLVRSKEVVLVLIKRSHHLIQFRQLAVVEAEKEQGEEFKNKPR